MTSPVASSPGWPPAETATSAPVPQQRRLLRRTSNSLLGGVASGISEHLRVPVLAVRLVFVALTFYQGLGTLAYLLFWVMLPADGSLARTGLWPQLRRAVVFIGGSAGFLLLLANVGDIGRVFLICSLLAVIVGGGLMWRAAGTERQQQWEKQAPRFPFLAMLSGPGTLWWIFRLVAGGLLVLVGLIGVLAVSGELNVARQGLLFSAVTLAGAAIVGGPWLWRYGRELRAERSERIRSQERAEIAAIVHDKVLHTLALIQRAAGDQREVARLARGQERELRNWLYKPAYSPDERLGAALEAAAAEVEDSYAVTIEVVLVGDTGMSTQVGAVVAAAREALVNAAKHAEVTSISLYAEVDDHEVAVFVRDRGAGFQLDQIAADRHGVRGSIVDRMQRHGGQAVIRGAPGAGTEVRLTMPLTAVMET